MKDCSLSSGRQEATEQVKQQQMDSIYELFPHANLFSKFMYSLAEPSVTHELSCSIIQGLFTLFLVICSLLLGSISA